MAKKRWIKVYYDMVGWEWYNTPGMLDLWVRLLLNADENGVVEISVNRFAQECGVSRQRLRTMLGNLVLTKQITKSATKSPTKSATKLIICNYASYQGSPPSSQPSLQPSSQPSSQPSFNQVDEAVPISSSSKSKHNREQEKKEILKKESPANEKFLHFLEWIKKNAPRVAMLEKPFTEAQYEKLRLEFTGEEMKEILTQMNNYKPLLSKYVSAYDTCRNWLARERERGSPATAAPKKTNQTTTKSVNSLWNRD
jgi:hypothetical protein